MKKQENVHRKKIDTNRPKDDKDVELEIFYIALVSRLKDLKEKMDMIITQIGNLSRSGALNKDQMESLEQKNLISEMKNL